MSSKIYLSRNQISFLERIMCIRIIRREMIHDTGSVMDNELLVRKNRWKDLYVPEGDKQKFIYLIGYPCEEDCGWEHQWRDRMKQRTEVAWKTYCAQMKHYQEVPDDTLPFLNIWTGTEIFAEALGCKVKKPEDNMPFAIPFVRSAHDLEKIRVPKLEDSSLMNLFEMADELKRLGAEAVEAQNGRVLFSGDAAMLARANLQSRFAERIQLLIGTFPAR